MTVTVSSSDLLAWALRGGAFHGHMEPPPVSLCPGLREGSCGFSLLLDKSDASTAASARILSPSLFSGNVLPARSIVFTEQPVVSHPSLKCTYYQVIYQFCATNRDQNVGYDVTLICVMNL